MRIDIVSIFPEFFSVLDISLLGKARQQGLLDVAVHDLRDFTHDRHRTVDDTPYGGGAGMVMKPEPWGEALDHVLGDDVGELERVEHNAAQDLLVIRTPGGEVLFPFVSALVPEVDVAGGRVVVADRPGLVAPLEDD